MALSENSAGSWGAAVCSFTFSTLFFQPGDRRLIHASHSAYIDDQFQTIVLNRRFKLSFNTDLILMKIPLLSSYFFRQFYYGCTTKNGTGTFPAPHVG